MTCSLHNSVSDLSIRQCSRCEASVMIRLRYIVKPDGWEIWIVFGLSVDQVIDVREWSFDVVLCCLTERTHKVVGFGCGHCESSIGQSERRITGGKNIEDFRMSAGHRYIVRVPSELDRLTHLGRRWMNLVGRSHPPTDHLCHLTS